MFERRGRDGDASESESLSGGNLSLRVEGWGFTVQPGVQALGYMSMQACLNFLAHFIVLTDDKGLPRGLLFIFKYSSSGVLFFAALDEANDKRDSTFMQLNQSQISIFKMTSISRL